MAITANRYRLRQGNRHGGSEAERVAGLCDCLGRDRAVRAPAIDPIHIVVDDEMDLASGWQVQSAGSTSSTAPGLSSVSTYNRPSGPGRTSRMR